MKPPDEVRRRLVRQWLQKAEEDYAVGQLLLEENTPYLATIGFHLQQATEKFLKALLVHHQVEFPRTHDLGKLLDLLASVETTLTKQLSAITILDPYSVQVRYPDDLPPVTRQETREAWEVAYATRERILVRLRASGH